MEAPSEENPELQKMLAARVEARRRDAQLRSLLKQVLEPNAYERLSNIRISNPEMYEKIATLLLSMAQGGSLNKKISEEQLRMLVARLAPQRDTKITFARK